jgi:hypothetical protein
MSEAFRITNLISDWSGKTPLDDFLDQTINVLEEELVSALYKRRQLEEEILVFVPQSSAPSDLIKSFIQSKLAVQDLESKIRMIRYSF